MVAPCVSNIKHFIAQQMHTNCKNHLIIKIVKIIKAAPTFVFNNCGSEHHAL